MSGKTSFDEEKSCIRLTLAPNYQQAAIHYTVDGSTPTLQSPVYKEPLDITSDCDIRAQLFRNGKAIGKEFNQSFKISQAVKKKARLQNKISEVYAAQGSRTLTDGIRGTVDFRDGNWVGTCNDDMILVVDFEQPTTYSKVNVGCLNKAGDWICLPVAIRVYASENENDYTR
nr:FN3 associated domain-containing protein [Odoribacter sp. OF09-27XD]